MLPVDVIIHNGNFGNDNTPKEQKPIYPI